MLQIRNSRSITPLWVRCIQESINCIRKDQLWHKIKRDEMKTKNMKRKRLLRKYNIEEKNLDQVTEELKQKVSAKVQQFSRYRKRQN